MNSKTAAIIEAATAGNFEELSLAIENLPDTPSGFKKLELGKVLHMACQLSGDKLPLIQLLIAKGANPNAQTEFGETPLHEICKTVSIDCLEALLSAGADPNLADKYGETPLHLIAKCDDCGVPAIRSVIAAMALELLLANANPTATNELSETPVSLARIGTRLRRTLEAWAWYREHPGGDL